MLTPAQRTPAQSDKAKQAKMTIRDELVALQKRHGILRPEQAVEWAREHPASALHAAVDWNDTTAAHQHRIWQIRQLIAVHVVNQEGVRQMVSLTIDRVNAGGYRLLNDVMETESLREVLLADALAELERIKAKYLGLVELTRVWEEADLVKKTKQAKLSETERCRS